MLFDECSIILVHSQAVLAPKRGGGKLQEGGIVMMEKQNSAATAAQPPVLAIHSSEELFMVGAIDAMPVMQAPRRVRAPITMGARPRLARFKPAAAKQRQGGAAAGRHNHTKDSQQASAPAPKKASSSGRGATGRTTKQQAAGGGGGRSKKADAAPPVAKPPPVPPVTYHSLLNALNTPDVEMKARALVLAEQPIVSEPVLAIHTAIRIVLQASLDVGRPYDTNMLASTFGTSRSSVMQSLRKYYGNFVEQSMFTERHFVPTYLWVYGFADDQEAIARIMNAIDLSDAAKPGCRSVFAIARDFVILYISEVMHHQEAAPPDGIQQAAAIGSGGGGSLVTLASTTAAMAKITSPSTVPRGFLEMTNSFLYRARMTGRQVLRAKHELIQSRGGTSISVLFNTST